MKTSALPLGLKIIIGFHVASFVLWLFGQSVAVVAYDRAAAWGLQDSRELIDPVIERLKPFDLHSIDPDSLKQAVLLMTTSELTRSQKEADRKATAYILASLFNV